MGSEMCIRDRIYIDTVMWIWRWRKGRIDSMAPACQVICHVFCQFVCRHATCQAARQPGCLPGRQNAYQATSMPARHVGQPECLPDSKDTCQAWPECSYWRSGQQDACRAARMALPGSQDACRAARMPARTPVCLLGCQNTCRAWPELLLGVARMLKLALGSQNSC